MPNVLDVCQRSNKKISYVGIRWLTRCSVTAPLAIVVTGLCLNFDKILSISVLDWIDGIEEYIFVASRKLVLIYL